MGIELVSPNAHERRPFLRTLHHLVGSFICFLRTLWTRLTQSHTPRASDLSFREPLLVDCEKGSLDVYQVRRRILTDPAPLFTHQPSRRAPSSSRPLTAGMLRTRRSRRRSQRCSPRSSGGWQK
ncbi:hypothetical protein B0H19DRAFT_448120 [Mycena capillaripes]|nr:hypothetical protein B0H19DRAFT_448120 [Mycena capillaripes]